MSIDTSKTILKIFGILGIISGIANLILGTMTFLGIGLVAGIAAGMDEELGGALGVVAIITAILIIISGLITLLEGVFSLKAVKDATKATPAWIFSILGFVSAVGGVISTIGNSNGFTFGSLIGPICTLIINGAIFVAANTIRQSVD